jgi:hypothetical protein
VPRLRDHERRPDADDSRRFAQDHLDPARILVACDLTRLVGGLNVGEADDAALGLRDDLLCEDDDVTVLELDRIGDALREVVARANLRPAANRDNADVVQGRPVRRIPACAL